MSASHSYCRAAVTGLSGLALWCVAGLVWAQTAIPFKRDSTGVDSEVSRLGFGMLVSIAVLALVLFWLRRHLRQTQPGRDDTSGLQISESKRLGPRSSLHVVHFAGQRYLIGQSEQGLVCLASSPLPAAQSVSTDTSDQVIEGQGETHVKT